MTDKPTDRATAGGEPTGRPATPTLLATVSHELRTPMDAILGYVEMLGETPLNDTQRSFLEAIDGAAHGLLALLDDLLSLSRLEAGKLVIHRQPFSVRDCLDSVAQMLAPSAYRRGLDFIQTVDHDVPVNFIGDPLRVRQILVNLTGNAIKFTPRGKVRLRVSAHPFDDRRYELVIRVSDTGIGIAPEDVGRLFEPFSRPAARDHEFRGTGLGLAISRSLCEAMDGNIAVHSVPGVGSTFCVRIPLESVEESLDTGEKPQLLANRNVVVACPDDELAAWIGEGLRRDGALIRHVDGLRQLTDLIAAGECNGHIAVLYLGASDVSERERLGRRWKTVRGRLPLLVLAGSGSRRDLLDIEERFGGEVVPAHIPTASLARRIAAMSQRAGRDAPPDPTAGTAPQLLAGLRILVADDNPFGRDYLNLLLTRHGASVDSCVDGRAACELIARERYDLVLMDVRMPRVDGVAAMAALKNLPGCPPVVGLTAAPEECARAQEAGMTDCLVKPVRPARLLEYIVAGRHDGGGSSDDRGFIDDEMREELNAELPRRAAQLREALERGDMTTALEAAHNINGTAALCGFQDLQAIAASIEGLIRQHRPDDTGRLTGGLDEAIGRVLASLAKT